MFKKKEMGEFHTKDSYKVLDVYNYQVNLKKNERREFHTQLIHYLLFLYIDWTYKREFKKNIPAKILFEV